MNASPVAMGERERARTLALIGVERWVLRARGADVAHGAAESASPVARVAIDAGPEPLAGPYAKLLAHVLAALRVAPGEVSWSGGELPRVCFGEADGAGAEAACRAPALERVRNEAGAKRALWRSLRPLAKRLRSEG